MISFQELKLPGALERGLRALNFETPTPIQAQAIPLGLEGRDLVACAQTGTGKTAAFCVPMGTHLLENMGKTALVLAPTRELAQQIEKFWQELTQFAPTLRACCLIGGVSFSAQARQLSKRPRLIIATPGRLIDHLNQRTISLQTAEILVLDEADRMLDMGFAPQLNKILPKLPKNRQTMLFTATWDKNMDGLAKAYLRQPEKITVGVVSQAAATIEQKLLMTTVKSKNETLVSQLNLRSEGSALIFARTQARTDRLARFLNTYGFEVGRIHGGRTQGQRNTALSNFRDGSVRILVATDIAARGIDVAEIAHVINYDLPQQPEDYIHRIGRTGRAGMKGEALSLMTPEDRSQWLEITKLLKKSGSPVPNAVTAEIGTLPVPAKVVQQGPAKLPVPNGNGGGGNNDGQRRPNQRHPRGRRHRHQRSFAQQ